MEKIYISGGKPLMGQIKIQGSKNAVLPILAATLLTDDTCVIKNCPDLTDVRASFDILKSLGCKVSYNGETATINTASAFKTKISDELMQTMRSSVMFLGALLGKCKKACISYPGGCALGARPIDIHLDNMRRLGVSLQESGECINCVLEKFIPQKITLMFPSVGATENLMLLCAISEGETILLNVAREPEIVDLQNFLNSMGADIKGAGTDVIQINGVRKLHGCTYTVISDRIVAATFACGVVACGGEVILSDTVPEHLQIFISVLRDMGAEIYEEKNKLYVKMFRRPKPIPSVKTLPYPGFPTDIQPLLMAAVLKAEGTSVFSETIFENRFKHVGEFLRMGADIKVEGMNAIVRGRNIHGAKVHAADLRGGAALVIAGLSCDGETVVDNIRYINRGYENIAESFKNLGGDIRIIQ